MSRTTRRRAVRAVAPVAGLLAAGLLVWQGSYAAFSASTTNQQDSWASGQLVLKNNGVGTTYSATTTTPVINATNIVPGATTFTRCITVESTGTLAGALKFYRGPITDVNTLAPTFNLSDAINVKVDAATITNTTTVDPTCTAGTGTVSFPGASSPIAGVRRRQGGQRRGERPRGRRHRPGRLPAHLVVPEHRERQLLPGRVDQGRPELGDPVIP